MIKATGASMVLAVTYRPYIIDKSIIKFIILRLYDGTSPPKPDMPYIYPTIKLRGTHKITS
jgi:hypothetical protein